jgi:predicted enzyme related to lactoylglutathione lyase
MHEEKPMPTVTKHAPGSFCWIELATQDQDGARRFYSQLFGYEITDTPIGEGMVYTIMKLAGRDACAVQKMRPQDYPAGTPSHWMTYVAVSSADTTSERVKAAGGQVLAGPMDVMEHGRMAVCVDTLGAPFCIWQARQHLGVGVVQDEGALAWCQLNAPSTGSEKAHRFYTEAFDWSFREDPMGMGMTYTTWISDDGPLGGMMPMPPGVSAPAHWLVYFAAPNVDATTSKAKALGGQVMVPPTDIPGVGRFSVLADPQGAAFAVVHFTSPMA